MATITISVKDSVLRDFTRFCENVGLTPQELLNVCMVTIVRERRVPFIIRDTSRTDDDAFNANRPEEKRQQILDAYNEAKEELQNPDAEFCDDSTKLHDFLCK